MLRLGITARLCIAVLTVVVACGPESAASSADETTTVAAEDGDAGSTHATTTPTSATTMSTSAMTSSDVSTSQPETSSSSSADECSTTAPEACIPDLGTFDCNVDTQDCPAGWKCAPHSEDDDSYPESHRCVPLSPDPAGTGEPCTIIDAPYSGEDDCELNSICVVADAIGLTGICAPFCTYDEMPCPESLECTSISLGQYVCLPACDPLAQDCAEGQACYPIEPSNGRFNCLPHLGGAYGIECEIHSECGPGLFCDHAEHVPGCTSETCCTAYCDAGVADPSWQCPGFDEGQLCDNWFCGGAPEPALENLGICGVWTCN